MTTSLTNLLLRKYSLTTVLLSWHGTVDRAPSRWETTKIAHMRVSLCCHSYYSSRASWNEPTSVLTSEMFIVQYCPRMYWATNASDNYQYAKLQVYKYCTVARGASSRGTHAGRFGGHRVSLSYWIRIVSITHHDARTACRWISVTYRQSNIK